MPPDVHTLTGPYVLDALPDPERGDFEQHLAYCESCTIEVTELREAAVKLATQVAQPPRAALKSAVMASLNDVRQLPPLIPDADSADDSTVIAPKRGFGRRGMLALAAAALAVATSGGIAIDQYRENSASRQQNLQIAAVLTQPDATTKHASVTGGGAATVVSSTSKDSAVVLLSGLPRLGPDRTYQMWMIDGSKTAHSVGLTDGSPERTTVISGVADKIAFGLTVEPAGGSTRPTEPVAALIPMA
ncbi:anti-sigma factor [Kribbella sandramycini]|uniref:Regulator of SigK n=1 Tax=Kribbella sandramycini TaxID=60450 RepID=A0A7Y4L6V5_9ACTN|nr:anti-sigma factor [Kribbella sandramycini]MBB6566672.1 anti-sigma-K factor RskA [Kribbella sandramycini]NOL45464.1 anti-sigma factor [Kribbella sandramycini]